jgi:peroxiredoxin Q/BCP
MTKGCTIESCGFRDRVKDLEKLNTVVLGISTDKLEDQVKFTDKEKLTFPLLADADKKVATAFGVLRPTGGIADRYTFIIDKTGTIRKVVGPPDTNPMKHPEEVLTYIKENLAK